MMRLLVASLGNECVGYVRYGQHLGMKVRVLDCVEAHHKRLTRQYGDAVLHSPARRAEVKSVVEHEQFDAAIVHEDTDFVRTALITQALREAGIPTIIVVTRDGNKRTLYRRCGAHHIIVTSNDDEVWAGLNRILRSAVTA